MEERVPKLSLAVRKHKPQECNSTLTCSIGHWAKPLIGSPQKPTKNRKTLTLISQQLLHNQLESSKIGILCQS
ncbi:uncharacterized protein BDR25DRAFT_350712 [Lindgomyces ingoldianus]|uniref:Uncharacterized protein n=1 Tax=Lindgomyces ingoldianus TaxID=673940 RepID=A0ACB6R7N2_9PLEO|nr:uncharacterized protein BDR25DRAFT_350712 [Lindgomyces ingoldianus]KAF2475323.1 hypothetical protein BDR25DRAFT_350712 [Lindgomyces ingoldianus]